MIKEKQQNNKPPFIDLNGPNGNAFVLLGVANTIYKQVGKEYFTVKFGILAWDEIEKEMTSGDYENLIQVFDKYFGGFIDLVR